VEPAHARLRLRRTGGLAGLPVEAALDTADLDPGDAEPILAALDAAQLDAPEVAALQAASLPPGPPDAFAYELDVARGGRTRRLRFGEHDMPESLRPLVGLLRSRANPSRP
jgi:Emfourin